MKRIVLAALLCPLAASAMAPKACVTVEQAAKLANKDVCVSAHVYDVVELPDGTRLLDVCSPEKPDADCAFTVVSLREDREQVGELRSYRDADVRIRGTVQAMSGRSGMLFEPCTSVSQRAAEVPAECQAPAWVYWSAERSTADRSQPEDAQRASPLLRLKRVSWSIL